MPRLALVIAAVLLVVVVPADAAEFLPSWDLQGVWSSNVFLVPSDEQSDFSVRTGPKLRVREAQGDFTYDAYYQFSYEAYARIEGLNDIEDADQYFSGRGSWRATPTTTITASDSFAYTTTLDRLFDDAGLVSTVTFGRERITSNTAEASLVKDLNPRWQLTASVGNRLLGYQNDNQSDTTSTNGTLQITHALTPRLIVGGGAQYQRQEFSEVDEIPSRGTTVYQGFGVMNYQISPTFRLSARAGPAFVQPDSISVDDVSLPSFFAVDPSTCPKRADGTPVILQFPQSTADLCSPAVYRSLFNGDAVALVAPSTERTDVPFIGDQNADSSLNYFGTISITKDWRQWRALLEYSRSASNSSGLSGSTVLDQFTGSVVWTPSQLWRISFDAIYSTQSALNETRQREIALLTDDDFRFINGVPALGVFGVPFEVDTGESITSEVSLTTTYFTLAASRRISRRLTLNGAATYWEQQSGGLLEDSRVRDVQFSLGFTWNFEPIPL
jgi:hypothetical protein